MKNTDYQIALPQSFQPSKISSRQKLALTILAEVMKHRRMVSTQHDCAQENCLACSSHHLTKIKKALKEKSPIIFILPAFPAKSPNLEKVLGPLPDMAEWLSLKFLQGLCEKIQSFYSPGAKIILCSDGRVFSDVVGIAEKNVTAYQKALNKMIQENAFHHILSFNLDDHYGTIHFDQMRSDLMKLYGNSIKVLKQRVKAGHQKEASAEEIEANRMYCGITRFLFEDAINTSQTASRSSIQKQARIRAYEVIRRSNAWSELISKRFPDGVRLSIHPQTCGAKKLGIRLIGNECWMTPWHGVAVESQGVYSLLKKSEAESLGAKLILNKNGYASHYQLPREHQVLEAGEIHGL